MPAASELLGDGPTIVFTHGWMMSRRVWERQRALADSFRLLFWDLPDHGDSKPTQGPVGLDGCARALNFLVTSLNIEAATYVGWSLGMSVLWRYCELFGPGPFEQVINVEMLPAMDPEAAMVAGVEKSLRRDRERAMRKFAGRVFHQITEAELAEVVRRAGTIPLGSAIRLYREMAAADFTATARALNIPQRLVFGRLGFYADREREIRRYFPDDPLTWFEHSGHAPFWDEAKAFNQQLHAGRGH